MKASSALLIKSAKGSLFPGVCGHSLIGLDSAVWLEGCSFGSSCSTTPSNHDVWSSMFVWLRFDGDLDGDLDGDFSGLCSTLSSYRKAFDFVRDFEEIGYELWFFSMVLIVSGNQVILPGDHVDNGFW